MTILIKKVKFFLQYYKNHKNDKKDRKKKGSGILKIDENTTKLR